MCDCYVPYTTITRQRTVYFGTIRLFSVHSSLTKDTGENVHYCLHFSQLSYTKEILNKRIHFSTVNNNSQISLTLSSTIVYISHILYAVLDYWLHFSIYFCPVWLGIRTPHCIRHQSTSRWSYMRIFMQINLKNLSVPCLWDLFLLLKTNREYIVCYLLIIIV